MAMFIATLNVSAGNKILYYFNRPVDVSVSSGVHATYLNNCMGDTLVAYINRSKYTIDVAVYNYTSTFPAIAIAINNAYNRGVKIRWIFDSSQSNTGLPLLNTSINKLGSPTTSGYTIMHNKFMVIDANSTNPADAIVWTGSTNWNLQQFNYDFNNVVVVQDSALAHAYRKQFNMMWGDTAIMPNTSLSKFGQYKTDLGLHNFTIEGKHVELYFSPSDGTNGHIQSAISSANSDLYFGMYTFTHNSNAALLVTKNGTGVYVAGIIDNSSSTSGPYTTLTSGIGTSRIKLYTGSDLYHNKFLIVDPSNKCSDPLVLTGSHNWSVNADTKNDENTLIIHDDTAANIYYQSFKANFALAGGTLATIVGCPTGESTPDISDDENTVHVYPNPTTGEFSVSLNLHSKKFVSLSLFNTLGQKIQSFGDFEMQDIGKCTYPCNILGKGIFYIVCVIDDKISTKIIIVQ